MFVFFKNLFVMLWRGYILSKYNDFTIADYFRKQGAKIGRDNRLQIRSLGGEPYLVSIGNHCTIVNSVKFVTHDGSTWVFTEEIPDLQKFCPIKIFDNCFVGMGSMIMPNVAIGPNAIVAAGSVVTKDVPENTIVAGVPAKPIMSLNEYREKVLKIWEKQKPPEYFQDIDYGRKYSPAFIEKVKKRDMEILRNHLIKLYGSVNAK